MAKMSAVLYDYFKFMQKQDLFLPEDCKAMFVGNTEAIGETYSFVLSHVTDAPNVAIDIVLQQLNGDNWKAISYSS